MFLNLKNMLKENKVIVNIYMKLYGRKKEEKRLKLANETLHNEGFQYLETIEKCLTKAKARYFVNFGTLLGLLRSGSFISWDTDLDYGIYIDNSFTWSDLEKAMQKIGMTLAHQFSFRGMITEQTYKTDKLSVDFFAHMEDRDFSYEYVYFWKKDYPYKSPNETHVSQLKMYKFTGLEKRKVSDQIAVEITVPAEAEQYLASIYTANWREPDPNWISAKGPAWNELQNEIGTAKYY